MIVIVGASGYPTSRKLVPALYNLFLKKALPDRFAILGCSRTEITDEGFRDQLKEAFSQRGDLDSALLLETLFLRPSLSARSL